MRGNEQDQLQTNLLLVGEVEKHEILYKSHLPGYLKKHETEKAWTEVANVVQLTAYECKERWKNIRAVFVRHMKKSGSENNYYLSDALQFTVPYIKVLRKPSENFSQLTVKVEDEFAAMDQSSTVDDDDPLETPVPSPLPSSSSSSLTAFQQQQEQPIAHFIPKKICVSKNFVNNALIEYFKHNQVTSSPKDNNQLDTEPRDEALKMFLLSLLPDLMKMDDREVRLFKRKMLDTVDEILSAKSTSTNE